MKKIKKSTYLPILLFIYLVVMAIIGLPILHRGEYLYYFSVFGISLTVIILLHFTLKRKERLKAEREQEKYADNEK